MNKTGRSDIPDRPVVLLKRNMEFSMKVIHLHAAGYIFDFALSARGQAAIGIKYSRASFAGESNSEMAQKTGRQDGCCNHDQPDFPRFHKNTALELQSNIFFHGVQMSNAAGLLAYFVEAVGGVEFFRPLILRCAAQPQHPPPLSPVSTHRMAQQLDA